VKVPVAARVFVAIFFLVFCVAFLGQTILFAWEFWDAHWFDIASLTSTVFIFFPTFGIIALFAFYLPAAVLVDNYWRYARLGKIRFVVGAIAIAAISYWIGAELAAANRGLYMIAPSTLIADKGEPDTCAADESNCNRLPMLDIVANVHRISTSRLGLAEFIHQCETDPFLDNPVVNEQKRFCFASTPLPPGKGKPQLSTSAQCCHAQALLRDAIAQRYDGAGERSVAAQLYQPFMTVKVFFLFVALTINLLLVLNHNTLARHYAPIMPQVEVCIIAATVAMLFYPLMYQGDIQALDALYGTADRPVVRSLGPYLSLLFGVGALLVVLFFYRRRDKQLEQLGKMTGVVAGALAVIKYDQVIGVIAKLVGSGSSRHSFVVISILSVIFVVALLFGIAWHARKSNRPQPSV
jgi:hypothetical protein